MTYMDIEFPGDVRDAQVRSRRNISDAERWLSLAAGLGLAAYGLVGKRGTGAGLGIAALGGVLVKRGVTAHCDAYQLMGINTAGTRDDTRRTLGGRAGVHVDESVTINQPVEILYRFWRNLENLPRFMRHLESVERVTDTLSRWRAKGPAGSTIEWNAEIINEVPNQVIVRVRLQYSPPGGKLGAAVAKLLGRDPGTEIREDLRQFKQILETGEIPTTAGQPRG
jgi:uncharacterized membrane protein